MGEFTDSQWQVNVASCAKSLGNEANAVVGDYTITVKMEDAKKDTDLKAVAEVGIVGVEKIGVKGNVNLNAGQLMNMFEKTGEFSALAWKFEGNNGKTYTEADVEKNWDLGIFKSVKAIVTAQDGAKVEYALTNVYNAEVTCTVADCKASGAPSVLWADENEVKVTITKTTGKFEKIPTR